MSARIVNNYLNLRFTWQSTTKLSMFALKINLSATILIVTINLDCNSSLIDTLRAIAYLQSTCASLKTVHKRSKPQVIWKYIIDHIHKSGRTVVRNVKNHLNLKAIWLIILKTRVILRNNKLKQTTLNKKLMI